MEEWFLKNPVGSGISAVALIYVGWKFMLPMLTAFVNKQTAAGESESATIEQLSRVLKEAIQRSEDERMIRIAAEKERDAFFTKLTLLEAKLEVALAEIESRKKENAMLQYQLDLCRGSPNAPNTH